MENNTVKTLDYLMKLKAEKKKTTKMEIESFCESWIDLAKMEGYTERVEKYLYGGISYAGAKPLFVYLGQVDSPKDVINKFLNGKMFGKNNDASFRLVANLLALLLNDESNIELVEQLIKRFPKACVNKDKKLLGTVDGIMTKQFFADIAPNTVLPALIALQIKPVFIDEFVNCMDAILMTVKPEGLAKLKKTNMDKVRRWIDDYRSAKTNVAVSVTEEKCDILAGSENIDVTATTAEMVEVVAADILAVSAVVEAVPAQVDSETVCQEEQSADKLEVVDEDDTIANGGSDPIVLTQHTEIEPSGDVVPTTEVQSDVDNIDAAPDFDAGNPVEMLATLLQKATDVMAVIQTQIAEKDSAFDILANLRDTDLSNLRAAKQQIAELQATVDARTQQVLFLEGDNTVLKQKITHQANIMAQYQAEITARQDTISTLRAKLMTAENEIVALHKEIADREATISIKEAEIEERKTMAEVLSRDRAKQADELVQKMASRIRVEYQDFQDALGMEMTCDLGENLRLQLESVFDILEKGGMKFK